jgi:predicted acyltransferase
MAPQGNKRLLSVDFLRGATVAFMIVANNPGDTSNVYRELLHSHWHGWTVVDFIFPLFLFLVGVSVALAVRRGSLEARKGGIWPRAVKRAAVLFVLGLVVNGFPFFDLNSLRIPGVLQRIAVVYLAALWLHRRLGKYGVAGLAMGILVAYWLLWAFVPVPGLGYPTMDSEYNLEGWLDQMLMRGHIWEYDTSWDPEGVLSTFPCISLALFGVLAGRWLKAEAEKKPGYLVVVGVGLAMYLGGLAWDAWFPINKSITTSSFVLFVGGFALVMVAVAHRLMDDGPPRAWMLPFLALGRNALFIYVASQLLAQVLFVTRLPWVATGGKSLHFWLFDGMFGSIGDRYAASMLWALALLATLTLVAVVMDRKGWVVKL